MKVQVALLIITQVMLVTNERRACKPGHIPYDEPLCTGGYAMRCNNTGLQDVPTAFPKYTNSSMLCLLDLSHNNITHIHNDSFTHVRDILWLYLNENHIRRIDSDAFVNLTSLQYLNLTLNHLHPESFGDGVFKPLINLTYINLKFNNLTTFDGLQTLLKPLQKLEMLYITGCYKCTFGKGFETFKHLKNVSLSGISPNVCNISVVVNDTFEYLPQVENVFMSSCNIERVEEHALKCLKSIRHVDFAYNEKLTFNGIRNILGGLINSSINVLNLNHIHKQIGMGTKLKYEHMEPIQFLPNLTMLLLDLNKLEVIEKEVLALIPSSTYFIALSGNRLTYDEYASQLHNMKHIISLDISHQHLNYDPFLQAHYEEKGQYKTIAEPYLQQDGQIKFMNQGGVVATSDYNATINDMCSLCLLKCSTENIACLCLPRELRKLNWRKSFVYYHVGPLKICPPSSLENLELSFNLLTNWSGPLYGFEKLQKLNLAENFCSKMSSYFFDNFNNLRSLNISYNLLGPILNPVNIDAGEHFKNLTNLEELDLSENRITALSVDVFKNLNRLQYLHLSRNMLGQWDSTLESKCLRMLDVTGNKLETLPVSLRNYLDGLMKISKEESCNRSGDVRLVLSENPIQCNCDSRPFLRWLSDTKVDVHFSYTDECHLQDGRRLQLTHKDVIPDFVKHLDTACFPFVSVIVSVCTFLCSLIACVLVYRYRWRLRHWYYSKRKRHRHTGYDRLFERDAFISYAKTECRFIKSNLVPALEGEQRSLKVWVADRDSIPGISLAENLVHAINNSKKTVLLFSRSYFKESWCDFEMNLARMEAIDTHRKLFVIVLYDDMPTKEIPLDYLRLLQSEKSIEYPTSPQYYETFWDSLCSAIQDE